MSKPENISEELWNHAEELALFCAPDKNRRDVALTIATSIMAAKEESVKEILEAIADVPRWRCIPGVSVATHHIHTDGDWVLWNDIRFIGMGPIYA